MLPQHNENLPLFGRCQGVNGLLSLERHTDGYGAGESMDADNSRYVFIMNVRHGATLLMVVQDFGTHMKLTSQTSRALLDSLV